MNVAKGSELTKRLYDRQAASYDRWVASMEQFLGKGRRVFSVLRGDVLEVGVGTGLNLTSYDPKLAKVVAVDLSPNMVALARRRVAKLRLSHVVSVEEVDVQRLSRHFPPGSFDHVTATCVFCSVPDPVAGYREIAKVLKPGGTLVELEHGVGRVPPLNWLLRLVDPLAARTFGFHVARDHDANLRRAGFRVLHRRELDATGVFRVLVSRPAVASTE
ncbi:MAG: class I SAM-dependent methyltransferase [Promethearchaeota archaeon]